MIAFEKFIGCKQKKGAATATPFFQFITIVLFLWE